MSAEDRTLVERVEHYLDLRGVDAEAADAPTVAGALKDDPTEVRAVLADLAGEDAPAELDTEDTGPSKYRRLYERAADLAGRETWEVVEEEYIREVFAEEGFADLVDSGQIKKNAEWSVVDFSDEDDDEADWRYYCTTGDEPRPDEFKRFAKLLTANAPDGYEPHFFRVAKAGKAPALEFGGWKSEDKRLSVEEAVEWMGEGGNVGIAGLEDGPLVNVDIDDDERTTVDDLKPTLRARSRSRGGFHGWYFDVEGEVPNIPTDTAGEVRTDDQYVVAPGSFVASAAEEIADGADHAGYYTVEEENPVASITYDELPEVFREFHESTPSDESELQPQDVTAYEGSGEGSSGGRRERSRESSASHSDVTSSSDSSRATGSEVYDVEARDLVSGSSPSDRFSSIFHGSDTGSNMALSSEGKLHCWRHNVVHGGLQALAVLSDLSGTGDSACMRIGRGHKSGKNNSVSGAGPNRLKGDWRLVWYAWHYAKGKRIIPEDDPIPYRALVNLAVDDGLLEEEELIERETEDGDTYVGFPNATAYNIALAHVATEYDRDPGREPAESRAEKIRNKEAKTREEKSDKVLAMLKYGD